MKKSVPYALQYTGSSILLAFFRKVFLSFGQTLSTIPSTEQQRIQNNTLRVRSHPMYYIQVWNPQDRKDIDLLEQVQRRTTKMTRGLEHLSCEDRLRPEPREERLQETLLWLFNT